MGMPMSKRIKYSGCAQAPPHLTGRNIVFGRPSAGRFHGVGRAPAGPPLGLEEIESPRALEWVKTRDVKSLAELKSDPRFAQVESDAKAVVLASDRIPAPELRAGWIYNF